MTNQVIGATAIPFINPSSGTMGNNGALSALTALPTTYPSAYMWFAANQIAAGVAAGWYYVQMSTTQAGTVFNNTYTTGNPTIPASPTPFVTTGSGAITGDTTEVFAQTLQVSGGLLGLNGLLRLWTQFSVNNNANAKTIRVRYSGNAGTTYEAVSIASLLQANGLYIIQNRGVTNSQIGHALNNGTTGVSANAPVLSAVDTTVATTVVISMQKAVATDYMISDAFCLELLNGA